jgi:hypothetical protein
VEVSHKYVQGTNAQHGTLVVTKMLVISSQHLCAPLLHKTEGCGAGDKIQLSPLASTPDKSPKKVLVILLNSPASDLKLEAISP